MNEFTFDRLREAFLTGYDEGYVSDRRLDPNLDKADVWKMYMQQLRLQEQAAAKHANNRSQLAQDAFSNITDVISRPPIKMRLNQFYEVLPKTLS
jgi:hypothetical protein